MILYTLYHGGHLPIVLVHKMTVHLDEEAVLLVGNKSSAHIGKAMDMTPMLTLFKKIVYFDASCGYNIEESVDAVEKAISDEFDQCFEKENLVVEDFSKIYNLVDVKDSFGIYLSIKGLPWIVFDDFDGKYAAFDNNPKRIYNFQTNTSFAYNDCLFQRKVFEPKTNLLITLITQQEFNHIEKLRELTEEKKAQIIGLYGIESLENAGTYLMLPSSRAEIVATSVREDKYFNQYFFSTDNAYYFSNSIILDFTCGVKQNIVIKPHPSITKTLPNEVDVISYPRYFPAEFMPFIKGLKYDLVVGHASSSIKNLPKLLEISRVISYNKMFRQKAYLIFRLYMTYVVSEKLFGGDYVSFGIDNVLIKDIKRNVDIDFPPSNTGLKSYKSLKNFKKTYHYTVIDNSNYEKDDYSSRVVNYIRKVGVNDVVVVVNSKDDYPFIHADYDFTDFMIPVKIQKKVSCDYAVGNFQHETIYFFCKNQDIRNKIKEFRYCRHLDYTGIELFVTPFTDIEMQILQHQMFLRREKQKELDLLKQVMNDSG